jgi:hypothetical protein
MDFEFIRGVFPRLDSALRDVKVKRDKFGRVDPREVLKLMDPEARARLREISSFVLSHGVQARDLPRTDLRVEGLINGKENVCNVGAGRVEQPEGSIVKDPFAGNDVVVEANVLCVSSNAVTNPKVASVVQGNFGVHVFPSLDHMVKSELAVAKGKRDIGSMSGLEADIVHAFRTRDILVSGREFYPISWNDGYVGEEPYGQIAVKVPKIELLIEPNGDNVVGSWQESNNVNFLIKERPLHYCMPKVDGEFFVLNLSQNDSYFWRRETSTKFGLRVGGHFDKRIRFRLEYLDGVFYLLDCTYGGIDLPMSLGIYSYILDQFNFKFKGDFSPIGLSEFKIVSDRRGVKSDGLVFYDASCGKFFYRKDLDKLTVDCRPRALQRVLNKLKLDKIRVNMKPSDVGRGEMVYQYKFEKKGRGHIKFCEKIPREAKAFSDSDAKIIAMLKSQWVRPPNLLFSVDYLEIYEKY